MIDNLVKNYNCPFCASTQMSEKHVDIVGAAGNTVNIDMHCPSCKKHFIAKTEIVHMEVGETASQTISNLQKSLLAMKGKIGGDLSVEKTKDINTEDSMSDKEILTLRKQMGKKDFHAGDLFS